MNPFEIKAQIKKELIDYYDRIRGDIEYYGQIQIEDDKNLDYRSEIVDYVEIIIERINQIMTSNLEEINIYFENKYKSNPNKEEIKKTVLSNYIAYVKPDQILEFSLFNEINLRSFNKFNIGVLIETGWYIDDKQLKFIEWLVEDQRNRKAKFEFNQDVLLIWYLFMRKNKTETINSDESSLSSIIGTQLNRDSFIKILGHVYNHSIRIDLSNCSLIEQDSFIYLKNLKCLEFLAYCGYSVGELKSKCFNGLERLTILDLSEISIKKICSNAFDGGLKNLEKLLLFDSKIEILEEDAFIGLECLNEIILSQCVFSTIQSNTFKHMTNLKRIEIDASNIFIIRNGMLDGLKSLKEIELNELDYESFNSIKSKLTNFESISCSLEGFNAEMLNKLVNLKHLIVKGEQIDNINCKVFDSLVNLEKICFTKKQNDFKRSQNFCKIFSFFGKLNNLKIFELHEFDIKTLKASLLNAAGLHKLENLCLNDCNISKIEKSAFANMKNLQSLDLSNNNFIKFNWDCLLGDVLNSLNKLNLRGCNIEMINANILQNSQINSLDFSRNHLDLSSLSILLSKFNNLKELNLSFCYINNSNMPQMLSLFNHLTNLQTLDLSWNELRELTTNIFYGLVNLKYLDLHCCLIRSISPNAFQSLLNLDTLILDMNYLENITVDIFYGLNKLKSLKLINSQIKYISTNAFENTPNLEVLNLSQNLIQTLEDTHFKGLSNLRYLDITNNPCKLNINNLNLKSMILSIF